MTVPQPAARPVRSRPITTAGYRGAVPETTWRDSVDERSETDRINDLEAWAFRAGRDLAEIKGSLREKSTVSAVDALHQDVRDFREEVRQEFAELHGRFNLLNERLDGTDAVLATQRELLEEILRRLPAAS